LQTAPGQADTHARSSDPYLDTVRELDYTLRGRPFHGSNWERRFQTILVGFEHLTDITMWTQDLVTGNSEYDDDGVPREPAEMLRAATKLRRLDFTYSDYSQDIGELHWEPDLSRIGPLSCHSTCWPALKSLSITIENMPARHLIQAFRVIAPSLRRLVIRDSMLHDVGVLIRDIPKILQLQYVHLECLLHICDICQGYDCLLAEGTDIDEPYVRAVKGYLLREAELPPTLKLCEIGDYGAWDDSLDGEDPEDESEQK
jgi:hypothetical protein